MEPLVETVTFAVPPPGLELPSIPTSPMTMFGAAVPLVAAWALSDTVCE
jgi:hypothetical protein